MASEHTHSDALRWYLTGAASDGGAQADPDAALGNYRSSTRYGSMGFRAKGGTTNVTIEFVAGANGLGTGRIRAASTSTLAWTPPGGTEGTAVTIANGQTRVLEGDGDNDAFVVVTRDTTADLLGTTNVTCTDVFNGLWDNISSAERVAGETEYRCLCLKNGGSYEADATRLWLGLLGTAADVNAAGYAAAGAVTITAGESGGYADWPEQGVVHNARTDEVLYYHSRTDDALTVEAAGRDFWGDGAAAGLEDDVLRPIPPWRLALEAPAAQPAGYAQTIANEGTAPTSVSWHHSPHASDPTTVPGLQAGYCYFLWIARKVLAGSTADADVPGFLEASGGAV